MIVAGADTSPDDGVYSAYFFNFTRDGRYSLEVCRGIVSMSVEVRWGARLKSWAGLLGGRVECRHRQVRCRLELSRPVFYAETSVPVPEKLTRCVRSGSDLGLQQ